MYWPQITELTGNPSATIILLYLLGWQGHGSDTYWTYKTENEMAKETSISPKRQELAIKQLKDLNLIAVSYKRIPRTRHFHVYSDGIVAALRAKGYSPATIKPPGQSAQKVTTITTTTAAKNSTNSKTEEPIKNRFRKKQGMKHIADILKSKFGDPNE